MYNFFQSLMPASTLRPRVNVDTRPVSRAEMDVSGPLDFYNLKGNVPLSLICC